jgi:pimeloyl-ACP methyl ester carboxylesterase
MHRIPRPGAPVVLLQHGLEDASHTWVINFPEQSLGFILYDAGYDVWLGNSRGNTYSLASQNYSISQAQFWAWSFDEMAKYDLPAQIEYALATNGAAEDLVYIGHSQGTMQAFIAFSGVYNPEIISKVTLFIALAPVAYVGHVSSPLLVAMADLHLDYIFTLLGLNEFLPNTALLDLLLPGICDIDPAVCSNFLCLIMGCDSSDWNTTRYDVYLTHDPAGTSVQNMVHWAQMVRDDQFQMFDYGSASANQQHYGQSTPPNYNLGQVQVPTALFSGGKDDLADPTDVAVLLNQLPSNIVVFKNEQPSYSHLDFVWGMDAQTLIYPDVVSLVKQYSS